MNKGRVKVHINDKIPNLINGRIIEIQVENVNGHNHSRDYSNFNDDSNNLDEQRKSKKRGI